MRVPMVAAASSAVLFVVAGCGAADPSTARTSEAGAAAPSVLAVQNAKTARLEPAGDGYTLRLDGVDDVTVWFTDRPQHRAGSETTAEIVSELFDPSGGQGPPNAALVWSEADGERTILLELRSADYDGAARTLAYDATVLPEAAGNLADFGGSGDPPSGEVSPASLFIDSIFKKEVCELDVYNEVHNPPGVYGYIPEFTWSGDASQTSSLTSAPSRMTDLTQGSKWSFASQADDSQVPCGMTIFLQETDQTDDAAELDMYNPSTGSNSFGVNQCNGFQCSWLTITNSATYHVAFIICESGISDATCKSRAGF